MLLLLEFVEQADFECISCHLSDLIRIKIYRRQSSTTIERVMRKTTLITSRNFKN